MNKFEKISELIIENNNQFIIAVKIAGMPSVPDKTGDKNLKNLLESYLKHDLYVITRLDRPVSGIMLFAKSRNAALDLSVQLQKGNMTKKYIAIVEGQLKKEGTITNDLIKINNKAHIAKPEQTESKKSILELKIIKHLDNYTIVGIELQTGRFHQIRCQMANLGHPIKGDVKYGARRKNPDRSVYLHAFSLAFKHPTTGNDLSYECLPDTSDSLWKLVNE